MYKIGNLSPESNNQQFTFAIGGDTFAFRLHTFRNILYVSIYRNEELIVAGVKAINNAWLIPYKYLSENGNFRFEFSYDDYVDPDYFGSITRLCYYSSDEISEIEKGM